MISVLKINSRSLQSSGLKAEFCEKGVSFTMIIILLNFFRLHISDEQLKRRMLMAVPKKGRLYDQCIRLLERAGIKVTIRKIF